MKEEDKVIHLQAHKNIKARVQARKLLDACHTHILTHLKSSLQHMLDNADDTLFAMADKADNNTEQSIYFDSMRILRLNQDEIESRFFQALEDGFDQFWQSGNNKNTDSYSIQMSLGDLSLVGETDLEESLAMTNLITKLKNNYSQELNALEQRLGEIAPDISVDDDNNPMGPKQICTAFAKATHELKTDIKIKLIIYKLFDIQMAADIGHLFDTINAEFVNAGILPKIKTRIRQKTTSPQRDAVSNNQVEPTVSDSNIVYKNVDANLLNNLQHLLAQQRPGGISGEPGLDAPVTTAVNDVMVALTSMQHNLAIDLDEHQAGIAAGNIRSAIGSQLGIPEGQAVPVNSLDNDIIDVVAMLFDFILDDPNLPVTARALIARLQIPMLKVAILDKDFFARRLHPARQLLNKLAAAGLGLDSQPEGDTELLEKIETTVHRILDDFNNDIGLFEELLEDLSEFQQGRDTVDKSRAIKAYRKFEEREQMELARSWVRETLRESIGDTPLPKNVLKIIMGPWHDVMTHTYLTDGAKNKLWKNQLRFIDVLVWSVQPKEIRVDREKLARVILQLKNSLRRGLHDIGYPDKKIEIIFNAVEPYHQASLRGLSSSQSSLIDKDKDRRHRTNPNSFFLFESGNEPGMRSDQDEKEDETVVNLQQRKLRESIDQNETQLITLDEFESILDEISTTRNTGQSTLDSMASFEEMLIEDIATAGWESERQEESLNDLEDEYLDMARNLEIGKWIEFTHEQDHKVRAKLVWKSDFLGEYTFTDWKFSIVANKTIYALASELRQGTAHVINDDPLLERAFNTVMTTLSAEPVN